MPSWTGIYLGAGGGIQFGDLSGRTLRCTLLYDRELDGRLCNPDHTFNDEFDDNDLSFAGVVQGGYNLQIGSYFVTGSFVSWTFGDSLGSDHKRVFDAEDGIFGKWNTASPGHVDHCQSPRFPPDAEPPGLYFGRLELG